MKPINYYDVFVPGGIPTLTYNPRSTYNLESKVMAARENICKLMIVTGQTKIGKTVLVEKMYDRTQAVWIDGGSVSSEESFWEIIADQLDVTTDINQSETLDVGAMFEIGLEGQINFVFANATPSGKLGFSRTKIKSMSEGRTISTKTAAIQYISKNKVPIVVDDFHYIDRSIQTAIVRALKSPIMHGLPVIFIAIPNRKFDVIKVEREMTGRIEIFDIPVWRDDELKQIAEVGFKSLNVRLPEKVQDSMVREAMGSPHLMQEFCKAICQKNRIDKSAKTTIIVSENIDLPALFSNIAINSGRSLFEKLARGPRPRSDRIERTLKSGEITDIYGVIMEALLKMKPGIESIAYDKFRGYIRDVISSDLPQFGEVSRVLEKIAEISYNDGASTPVVDWDKDDAVLTITDPFFAFYLRWRDPDDPYADP